jgi:hypothetical protein
VNFTPNHRFKGRKVDRKIERKKERKKVRKEGRKGLSPKSLKGARFK